MGKRNWSRSFFRLWAALSLFWIMFVCGAAIVDLVRTLRLPPELPTFALAEQEADKKCGPSRSPEQIECREKVGFALTDQEMAAEETWRDAYEKRQERLDNLAPDLAVMLGLAVLPPLMLLLPGLGIAWLKRGFARAGLKLEKRKSRLRVMRPSRSRWNTSMASDLARKPPDGRANSTR
jgi:hypothetical protein